MQNSLFPSLSFLKEQKVIKGHFVKRRTQKFPILWFHSAFIFTVIHPLVVIIHVF